MRVIDAAAGKKYVMSCIKSNGSAAEHNYGYLLHNSSETCKPVFIDAGNKRGIMATRNKNTWKFISEPLAPEKQKIGILIESINLVLKSGAKKVMLELTDGTRKGLLSKLPAGLVARKPSYTYHWPVCNLKKFDPEFHGTRWKKLRNIRNYFEKNHEINLADTASIDRDRLIGIYRKWASRRSGLDRIEKGRIVNAIEEEFNGYEITKSLVVDGEPCTVSGGWKIPNSNAFYSSLGMLNYEHKYLGEYAIIAELSMLKKLGYRYVDLGGSGEYLLRFKMKFKPEYVYRTTEFAVAKK